MFQLPSKKALSIILGSGAGGKGGSKQAQLLAQHSTSTELQPVCDPCRSVAALSTALHQLRHNRYYLNVWQGDLFQEFEISGLGNSNHIKKKITSLLLQDVMLTDDKAFHTLLIHTPQPQTRRKSAFFCFLNTFPLFNSHWPLSLSLCLFGCHWWDLEQQLKHCSAELPHENRTSVFLPQTANRQPFRCFQQILNETTE